MLYTSNVWGVGWTKASYRFDVAEIFSDFWAKYIKLKNYQKNFGYVISFGHFRIRRSAAKCLHKKFLLKTLLKDLEHSSEKLLPMNIVQTFWIKKQKCYDRYVSHLFSWPIDFRTSREFAAQAVYIFTLKFWAEGTSWTSIACAQTASLWSKHNCFKRKIVWDVTWNS